MKYNYIPPFMRIVQYRGKTLPKLKECGINTALLRDYKLKLILPVN